jgi:RNA polymerase sigma-70 factor (ECF subfamily)
MGGVRRATSVVRRCVCVESVSITESGLKSCGNTDQNASMTNWLQRVFSADLPDERALVERYTRRLLDLARQQLPDRVRRRVDPEDVVQSVYRSFFRRLNDGQYSFDDSQDLWRLLAAMTFHKSRKAVRFHQQARRDVRREIPLSTEPGMVNDSDVTRPGPADLVVLFESLERLLNRVPDHYRPIVLLRLEGLSIAEIATKIARSQRTVLRALARLQELAAEELESSG